MGCVLIQQSNNTSSYHDSHPQSHNFIQLPKNWKKKWDTYKKVPPLDNKNKCQNANINFKVFLHLQIKAWKCKITYQKWRPWNSCWALHWHQFLWKMRKWNLSCGFNSCLIRNFMRKLDTIHITLETCYCSL